MGLQARTAKRCPWAIRFGIRLHTRCDKAMGHEDQQHEGPGLSQFPAQRVAWSTGDRREYLTGRGDEHAWEEENESLMQLHLIEVTNSLNWGKFGVGRFDTEWIRTSDVDRKKLLAGRGWTPQHVWVLDLQTGEGALFLPGGEPGTDLNKHRIWVCPLFEPFLVWLYDQVEGGPDWFHQLPRMLELVGAPGDLYGHRRPGPCTQDTCPMRSSEEQR